LRRRQPLRDFRGLGYIGRQWIKVAPCLEEEGIRPPAIGDLAEPTRAEMLLDHRSGQAGYAEAVERHLQANGIVGGGHDADLGAEASEMIIQLNRIVVVGMRYNDSVARARKSLTKAGLDFIYLEYGSYTKGWRRRLALKMWTGWPTFPMIFVDGVLIGGNSDLKKLLAAEAL
jgi:glutaredoxin